MSRKPSWAPAVLCTLAMVASCSRASAADASKAFTETVMPVLARRCVECHGGATPEAKLDLSGLRTAADFEKDPLVWYRMAERVEAGSMPPEEAEPLSPQERQAIVEWARGPLTESLAATQKKNGRSTLRRLTRDEYANTIRDLFGFLPGVKQYLPDDGRVDGYDKVADAVPFSAAGADGYVNLAEAILNQVLKPTPKEDKPLYAKAFHSEQSKGHILELPDGWMVSFNTDLYSGPLRGFSHRVPGVHRLKMHVYGYQTDKPLPFSVYAGPGGYPQVLELVKVVEAAPGKPGVVEADVYLHTAGNGNLGKGPDMFRLVPLGLGVPVPKNHQASQCKGPGLAVLGVDIEEPEWPPREFRDLASELAPSTLDEMRKPAHWIKKQELRAPFLAQMETAFARIGARFYRRTLTPPELKALLQLVADRYDTAEKGVNPLHGAFVEGMTALMTSPDFLCLIEEPGRLDDFAIASRLSYFLWNSCPDEELLQAAASGSLRKPKELAAQTDRLLSDTKASRFVASFTDQWLGLWGIDNTTPDKDVYPEYEEWLRFSSLAETRATLQRMLDENLSVRDFVAPNWALVNQRLAEHYGLPGVAGAELRLVSLPADSPFGGFWTQPATMKVTANGTVTSPIKRGVWVAERLLGVRIPPPPSNIEPVMPDTRGATTLREQLALHSKQSTCSACHAKFDAYGFALESFDVTGRYREHYRVLDHELAKLPPAQRQGRQRWKDGPPVDPSGVTPSGTRFKDAKELRTALAKDPAALARGVTRHLLTYATGAAATPVDDPAIEAIVKSAASSDFGLRSLVHGVVQSEVFQTK